MVKLTLFEKFRLKLNSLVNKKPESDFLTKKPKLTKIVGYNDVLNFNERSNYIFNQIKNQR